MRESHIINHNVVNMIPISKERTSMLENTYEKYAHSIHKRDEEDDKYKYKLIKMLEGAPQEDSRNEAHIPL